MNTCYLSYLQNKPCMTMITILGLYLLFTEVNQSKNVKQFKVLNAPFNYWLLIRSTQCYCLITLIWFFSKLNTLVSTEEMTNKAKNCLGLNDYRYLTGYFYSHISTPHLVHVLVLFFLHTTFKASWKCGTVISHHFLCKTISWNSIQVRNNNFQEEA